VWSGAGRRVAEAPSPGGDQPSRSRSGTGGVDEGDRPPGGDLRRERGPGRGWCAAAQTTRIPCGVLDLAERAWRRVGARRVVVGRGETSREPDPAERARRGHAQPDREVRAAAVAIDPPPAGEGDEELAPAQIRAVAVAVERDALGAPGGQVPAQAQGATDVATAIRRPDPPGPPQSLAAMLARHADRKRHVGSHREPALDACGGGRERGRRQAEPERAREHDGRDQRRCGLPLAAHARLPASEGLPPLSRAAGPPTTGRARGRPTRTRAWRAPRRARRRCWARTAPPSTG
jgi:hypothetical protein